MCTISTQLKLCTCKKGEVEDLKHYWILQRHKKADLMIMGDLYPPVLIDDKISKLNTKNLTKMLNSGECFDVDIQHDENDILELYFNVQQASEVIYRGSYDYIVYAFIFKKHKWKPTEHDPFKSTLRSVQTGKIKNAFADEKLN